MKYLQILNAVIAAAGAAMAINLAVVCLLYTVHVGAEPRLAADLPRLFVLTALFTALGAAGVFAFLGQRRTWNARWLLQALPALPVAGLAAFLVVMGR